MNENWLNLCIYSTFTIKNFQNRFYDRFVKLSDVQYSHATRQKRNIVYFRPCIKKTIRKRLLSHRGLKVWEKINHSLNSLSWLSFQKQYKKFYYPDMNKINWVPDCYHDFMQKKLQICGLLFL